MKYENPILTGLHPDPSICRVGNDYYLINSSFGFFPEIPIFHSRDLLQWEQIGHCLTEKNAVALKSGCPDSSGIFAPTIRYHEGIFYVIATNIAYGGKEDGNFFLSTKDPYDGWSDAVHIDTPGIDPSLFFDRDGSVYYTGAADGHIIFCEIDLQTGTMISDIKTLWEGTGGNDPEGPHLYYKDGWYYLLISEGGTEYCHMITMARSRQVDGPYEPCPYNPVLTNRSLSTPIKAVGHGDLFCDQNGNWWMVCLGIRPISYPFKHNLGRETMLVPVIWGKDGWPVCGKNGRLEQQIQTNALPLSFGKFTPAQSSLAGCSHFYDGFSNTTFEPCWNFLYLSDQNSIYIDKEEKGAALLCSDVSLNDTKPLSWLGRRQEHHCFTARAKLSFMPEKDGEEAGFTIYMNPRHHYEIAVARIKQKNYIMLRRQIGTLWQTEHKTELPDNSPVILEITGNHEWYHFSYSLDESNYQPLGKGECCYLTTEVGGRFAGNYLALYAASQPADNHMLCSETDYKPAKDQDAAKNQATRRGKALFSWFDYQAKQLLSEGDLQ